MSVNEQFKEFEEKLKKKGVTGPDPCSITTHPLYKSRVKKQGLTPPPCVSEGVLRCLPSNEETVNKKPNRRIQERGKP